MRCARPFSPSQPPALERSLREPRACGDDDNSRPLSLAVASTSMTSSAGDRLARFMLLSPAGDVVVLQESWLKLCPKVGSRGAACEFADGSGAAGRASPPSFRVISADGPDDRASAASSGASVGALADARVSCLWVAVCFAWLTLACEGSVFAALAVVGKSLAQLADIVPAPSTSLGWLSFASHSDGSVPLVAIEALVTLATTAFACLLLAGLLALLSALSPASAVLWLRVR